MPFKEVFAEGIKIACEAETSDTHENAKEKHTKYFELGANQLALGEYHDAINSLKQSLKIQNSADTYKLIGKAYFCAKMYRCSIALKN